MQLNHATKIADDLIRYFSASQVDDSTLEVKKNFLDPAKATAKGVTQKKNL